MNKKYHSTVTSKMEMRKAIYNYSVQVLPANFSQKVDAIQCKIGAKCSNQEVFQDRNGGGYEERP